MVDASKLFVVRKVLDDDNRPYTSYSYITSENGISIELGHAAIFASEEDARRGHMGCDWAVRQSNFRVVTLADAMLGAYAYNIEANEFYSK